MVVTFGSGGGGRGMTQRVLGVVLQLWSNCSNCREGGGHCLA